MDYSFVSRRKATPRDGKLVMPDMELKIFFVRLQFQTEGTRSTSSYEIYRRRKDFGVYEGLSKMYLFVNEQSIEWIASIYVHFVGFQRAFPYTVDRNALWKILVDYGLLSKLK